MKISRRTILKGAGALPLVAADFGLPAFAQAPSAGQNAVGVPPILFAHGNGPHAALWRTTLWRMESNGVPRERMSGLNFADPLARAATCKPEPNQSTTED